MATDIKEIEARLKAALKNQDVNFYAYASDDIDTLLAEVRRLEESESVLLASIVYMEDEKKRLTKLREADRELIDTLRTNISRHQIALTQARGEDGD